MLLQKTGLAKRENNLTWRQRMFGSYLDHRFTVQKNLHGQKKTLSHRSRVEKPGLLRVRRGVQKPGLLRVRRGVEKPRLLLRVRRGVGKPGLLRLLGGVTPRRPSSNQRSSTQSTTGSDVLSFLDHFFHSMSYNVSHVPVIWCLLLVAFSFFAFHEQNSSQLLSSSFPFRVSSFLSKHVKTCVYWPRSSSGAQRSQARRSPMRGRLWGFDMGKYGVYFKTATDDFFRWLSRNTSQETDLTIYSRYCKKVLTISTYLKHLGIFHNACSEALASSQAWRS